MAAIVSFRKIACSSEFKVMPSNVSQLVTTVCYRACHCYRAKLEKLGRVPKFSVLCSPPLFRFPSSSSSGASLLLELDELESEDDPTTSVLALALTLLSPYIDSPLRTVEGFPRGHCYRAWFPPDLLVLPVRFTFSRQHPYTIKELRSYQPSLC